MIDDLLALAKALVRAPSPTQAELRRGVSTAYYAVFHALAHDAADQFAGADDVETWVRVYRALDHGLAIRACQDIKDQSFGSEITACATAFALLQIARHAADYDPIATLSAAEAALIVEAARDAIEQLRAAPPAERRRFAVHLLFKKR